jgi:hypothetical protein
MRLQRLWAIVFDPPEISQAQFSLGKASPACLDWSSLSEKIWACGEILKSSPSGEKNVEFLALTA